MDSTHNKGENLTQQGREAGIRRLMSINLLKRLESSVHSFLLTLNRIKELIDHTIETIDQYEKYGSADLEAYEASFDSDLDMEDSNADYFTVGEKIKIDLADMDYVSWRKDLAADSETLELLALMIADITPDHNSKLLELMTLLSEKRL